MALVELRHSVAGLCLRQMLVSFSSSFSVVCRLKALFMREEPERISGGFWWSRLMTYPAHSWRFVRHDSIVGAYSACCPYRVPESCTGQSCIRQVTLVICDERTHGHGASVKGKHWRACEHPREGA